MALRAQEVVQASDFAALVARVSEPGGYFDTDNLISNETGYLNVVDALRALESEGGAYVGVGPDQNYSYIAVLRPEVAFLSDIRRDNMLQHLLLKALIERAPTRIEFLAALHGVRPPEVPAAWQDRSAEQVVAWVDSAWVDPGRTARGAEAFVSELQSELLTSIAGYAVPLTEADHETIRRFHSTFVDAGLSLRFTTFGRPARPYYPTYRQLVLETDAAGDPASYLTTSEAYGVVRDLHLANRIIPVVGDLSGGSALREIGDVLREMELELTAFYTSNVEFYLWGSGTFASWLSNLGAIPTRADAVVIRSYFPNFGGGHPSTIPGYYATQSLQPVSSLTRGGFTSYWDVVTRDVLPLR